MILMSQNQHVPGGKDPVLWKTAQKRAGFKKHALAYLIVNAFLWCRWLLFYSREPQHAWPLWITIGWGIGLVLHFTGTYVFPAFLSEEKEYQKLKSK